MSDAALEVLDLTGPARGPFLRDVALRVAHGGTSAVLGSIHAGKSLVLRHLVGLEKAQSGSIIVDGEVFDARGETEERLRRLRTRVGVVFQGSALVSRIPVVENVELPMLEHTEVPAAEARQAARELLAEVGLQLDDQVLPTELGRAAQRRVALARALALRPPLVLLDEPTTGLDSAAAAEFDQTLARLQDRQGFGALIFSHEVRHAYGRASQDVYVLADGVIVAHGPRTVLVDHGHEAVRRLLNRRSRTDGMR